MTLTKTLLNDNEGEGIKLIKFSFYCVHYILKIDLSVIWPDEISRIADENLP